MVTSDGFWQYSWNIWSIPAGLSRGLKKLSDEASATQTTIADNFDSGRFYRSILIGSVAGFVAAFSTISNLSEISHEVVLGIMWLKSYVGADFVEAFAQRYLPKPVTAAAGRSNNCCYTPACLSGW